MVQGLKLTKQLAHKGLGLERFEVINVFTCPNEGDWTVCGSNPAMTGREGGGRVGGRERGREGGRERGRKGGGGRDTITPLTLRTSTQSAGYNSRVWLQLIVLFMVWSDYRCAKNCCEVQTKLR